MIVRNLLVGGLLLAMVSMVAAQNKHQKDIEWPACSDEDRDISFLLFEEPYYPHSASMFCLSGEVTVRYTVDREGRSQGIEVIESSPGTVFDRSAVDAIAKWRFIPACKDGQSASHEVVQVIQFHLDHEAEKRCPDGLDRLGGEAVRLIGEVGARYALLFEHINSGANDTAIVEEVVSPLGEFDGDLARVARFHRWALEQIVAALPEQDTEDLFGKAYLALMPSSLGRENGLELARRQLAQYRMFVESEMQEAQRDYAEFAEAYRRLERDTKFDRKTLEFMVASFAGDPEIAFDEVAAPGLKPLAHLQRISEFLEQRRRNWHIADNDIHFGDEEDKVTWQALWEELEESRDAVSSLTAGMMRPFEDYSD